MNKVLIMMLAGMLLVNSTFAFAEDVYVTKNGKKYHKANCLLIANKGAKPISIEEALKKGLKPCHKCFLKGADTATTAAAPAPASATLAANYPTTDQVKK